MKDGNFQCLTLTLKSDQYVFSPHKINTLVCRQVMRIKKLSAKKFIDKTLLNFLQIMCLVLQQEMSQAM